MKDSYTNVFYDVIKETQEHTGLNLPEDLEAYVVMLLASYIDSPDFLPQSTIAECYLKLKRPAGLSAKELGDTCLFVSGVFPTYKIRYGLGRNYYSKIGISSYEMAAENIHSELFNSLATHFKFLSNFIELSCKPRRRLDAFEKMFNS